MFTTIKTFFLTIFGRCAYRRLVRTAERLHRTSSGKGQICVINNPFNQRGLMYIDRKGFRKFKDDNRFFNQKVTFDILRDGAWYYTNNYKEKGRMLEKDIIVRRAVFLKQFIERYS